MNDMEQNIQIIKRRFDIIGNTPKLNEAIATALRVAPTDLTVLILGESGVGKEVFPKLIHASSRRASGPYIAVNCGAIPEGTIDSELFGHKKGSFTGAVSDRKGYFEEANRGTIFLDEAGELPLPTQARLLRVLETGEYIPVGESKARKTDVRVVAATNVNLYQAVEKGRFREDLFYRLNTISIQLPPLRERGADIYLLYRKFMADFMQKYARPEVALSAEAKELLEQYPFPGNIRELRNLTERIAILESSNILSADKLRHYLPSSENISSPKKVFFPVERIGEDPKGMDAEQLIGLFKPLVEKVNELTKRIDRLEAVLSIMKPQKQTPPTLAPCSMEHSEPLEHRPVQDAFHINIDANYDKEKSSSPTVVDANIIDPTENLSIEEATIDHIKKALEKHHGKRRKAAEELGISERTLYRKIKEYHIES